jgi:hypothetical protein
LNLKAPKPSFANARHRSAFGFQAAAEPTPEINYAQDGEHRDEDMVVGMNDSANNDCDDMYVSEDGKVAMNEDVDGYGSGMIRPLSFNTLTFFART